MFLQTNFSYQPSALPPSPNFVSPPHSATFSPVRPPPSVSPQHRRTMSRDDLLPHHNQFRCLHEDNNGVDQAHLAFDAASLAAPPLFINQPQPTSVRSKSAPKGKKYDGPKGYISGFNFFSMSIRNSEELKDQLLKMANNDINKLIGKQWADLPPSKRAIFDEMGEKDKLRYLREVHEYNLCHEVQLVPKIDPPPGYDGHGQLLPADPACRSPDGCDSFSSGKQKRKSKPVKGKRGRKANPEKSGALKYSSTVQRRRTAYSMFAHQEKDFLSGMKCPDMQRRLGKYLGARWKNMPAAEKRMYDLLEASGATINKKARL